MPASDIGPTPSGEAMTPPPGAPPRQ
jgi:hypothetical protein